MLTVGAERDLGALRLHLVGDGGADLVGQAGIPAGADARCRPGTPPRVTPPTSEPPPRAPFGPSVTRSLPMPSRGIAGSDQKSSPERSADLLVQRHQVDQGFDIVLRHGSVSFSTAGSRCGRGGVWQFRRDDDLRQGSRRRAAVLAGPRDPASRRIRPAAGPLHMGEKPCIEPQFDLGVAVERREQDGNQPHGAIPSPRRRSRGRRRRASRSCSRPNRRRRRDGRRCGSGSNS